MSPRVEGHRRAAPRPRLPEETPKHWGTQLHIGKSILGSASKCITWYLLFLIIVPLPCIFFLLANMTFFFLFFFSHKCAQEKRRQGVSFKILWLTWFMGTILQCVVSSFFHWLQAYFSLKAVAIKSQPGDY